MYNKKKSLLKEGASEDTPAVKTVLDGITAEKVAAWDAAEQNAKDYVDGLVATNDEVTAMCAEVFGA